mgnify:CR=1 FL=1|jgi:hypothetical protein
MTEEELGAIKEMHSSAFNVWTDRKFEVPVAQLVEGLLFCMPAGDLMEQLLEIEKDIAESLAEEGE